MNALINGRIDIQIIYKYAWAFTYLFEHTDKYSTYCVCKSNIREWTTRLDSAMFYEMQSNGRHWHYATLDLKKNFANCSTSHAVQIETHAPQYECWFKNNLCFNDFFARASWSLHNANPVKHGSMISVHQKWIAHSQNDLAWDVIPRAIVTLYGEKTPSYESYHCSPATVSSQI